MSDFTKLGSAGSWSAKATPALVVDANGNVWVAAMKKDGRLFARYFDGVWRSWREVAPGVTWSTDAGISMDARNNGAVTLVGVSSTGTLYHATGNRSGSSSAWTGVVRHGVADSWSTTSPPAIAVSGSKIQIGVIKANGDAYTQLYDGGWKPFRPHGTWSWAPDTGMSLTSRADGNVSMALVTAEGTLMHRTGLGHIWTGFTQHGIADSWSTQSTPNMVVDGESRLWITHVKAGGGLYTSYYDNGWQPFTKHGTSDEPWSVHGGVSIAARSNGQVTLFGASADGDLYHFTGGPGGWTGLTQHGVAESWAG